MASRLFYYPAATLELCDIGQWGCDYCLLWRTHPWNTWSSLRSIHNNSQLHSCNATARFILINWIWSTVYCPFLIYHPPPVYCADHSLLLLLPLQKWPIHPPLQCHSAVVGWVFVEDMPSAFVPMSAEREKLNIFVASRRWFILSAASTRSSRTFPFERMCISMSHSYSPRWGIEV